MRVVHSGRWWAMVGILVSVRRTGGREWCGSGGWAQHSFVFFESKYLMQPHCLWTTLAVLCWISEKPTGYVATLSEQDKLFCKDIGLAWRVHFAWVEMYTCMERSIRSDFCNPCGTRPGAPASQCQKCASGMHTPARK